MSIRNRMLLLLPACLVASSVCAQETNLASWPQFRGPLGTGEAPNAKPPTEWSEEKNIKWKVPLPGLGHSTPVVWGDRLFVTTAIPFGPKFEGKPDTAPGAHDNVRVTQRHRFVLLAIDRKDGSIVWQKELSTKLGHTKAGTTRAALRPRLRSAMANTSSRTSVHMGCIASRTMVILSGKRTSARCSRSTRTVKVLRRPCWVTH